MKLINVDSQTDLGWVIWPQVRRRILQTTHELAPRVKADVFLADVQTKWVCHPNLVRVFGLVNDSPDPFGLPLLIGHIVGLLEINWGTPQVWIMQADLGNAHIGEEDRACFCRTIVDWMNAIDRVYEQTGSQLRVDSNVMFRSERDQALLRKYKPFAKTSSIMEVNLRRVVGETEGNGKVVHEAFGPLGG